MNKNPCYHCGSTVDIEIHHWAPKELFSDFNSWPTSPLCKQCHTLWHSTINKKNGSLSSTIPTDTRHNSIRHIILTEQIKNQKELVNKLKLLGYDITQATVSRDINILNVTKVNGYYIILK